jgi:hypothetical protein
MSLFGKKFKEAIKFDGGCKTRCRVLPMEKLMGETAHNFTSPRKNRWRLWCLAALAVALGVYWCVERANTVNVMGASDFKFSMGDGSGWHGYNTIKVCADGKCQYVFVDRRGLSWRRGDFVVDPRTLRELRELLVEIDFFRLKETYHDPNIADGIQRWAWVEAYGMHKSVYCNNRFPEPFQELYTFVQKKVIRPHEEELQNAPMIDQQEARQAAVGY